MWKNILESARGTWEVWKYVEVVVVEWIGMW